MSELGRSAAFDERPSPGAGAGDAPVDESPAAVAWRLCAAAPLTELDRQRLLEEPEAAVRLELLTTLCDEVADDVRRMLSDG
jgi:Lon protease-like protein